MGRRWRRSRRAGDGKRLFHYRRFDRLFVLRGASLLVVVIHLALWVLGALPARWQAIEKAHPWTGCLPESSEESAQTADVGACATVKL